MKAKQRVLLVLLAVVVLLGIALWAVTCSNAKAEEAASAAAEGTIPLSSFAVDDLEQIEYTWQGETYTLQDTADGWVLAQDPAYHLDSSACDTMRTALMALNAKRQLTAQAGEDYGLADPLLTVTVTAAGESTTLAFGAENPVTGDLYVQKAGDDAIYTVDGNKAACFELDKAGLFGSFCPAGLTASSIQQVAYTLADGSAVTLNAVSEPVESTSSESTAAASDSTAYQTVWHLAEQPEAELDADAVQSLLSALCTYVTGQITGADGAAYGFDAPVFAAQVTTAEGTVQVQYASGTDSYYLQVEGDNSVYTVDPDTVQALLLTADDLKTE